MAACPDGRPCIAHLCGAVPDQGLEWQGIPTCFRERLEARGFEFRNGAVMEKKAGND